MNSEDLKLEFVKRILIGCINNQSLLNDFFELGKYPDEGILESISKEGISYKRMEGLDQPNTALSMIGKKRMDNLHKMLDYVRINNVPGDLIETGVWRGGATIFMKVYCDLYNMDKKVFVCDSFEGLPKPSGKFEDDFGDTHHTMNFLKVSLEAVKSNFSMFRCLDENVVFVKGFFGETLPGNDEISDISLLRMDGDMYESTHDVFYSLYHKVSKDGVVIVDDYCLRGCRKCVEDFRAKNSIVEEFTIIDKCGIFWIKKN